MDTAQDHDDRCDGRVVTFYSYKGGTGRTMTLANAAWILAANGKRVLTVDWDLEAPGLFRFFHPFLDHNALRTTGGVVNMINDYLERVFTDPRPERARESGRAAVPLHAISLSWDFPGGGGIDFISAGKQDNNYSTILNGLNWDEFYQDYEGGSFLDALRDEMRASYDYTLIDSRTGLSDSSMICTQHLPDDLVVCFTLSDQSIDGAAGVARLISERFGGGYPERSIRILPVPMRIDDGEKDRAERGRAVARQRFRGLPTRVHTVSPTQYWGSVEIPYRAFYAYEEMLATFGDEAGLPSSVLAATERLVAELTRGEVTRMPQVPEPLRQETVAKFARKDVTGRGDYAFQLWYAIEDQMWADWVHYVLDRAGFGSTPLRIDLQVGADGPSADPADSAPRNGTGNGSAGNGATAPELVSMPLLTRHFMRTARAEEVWGGVRSSALTGPPPRTMALRLGMVQPGAPAGHSAPLDLSSPSLNGAHAAEQLIRHIGGDDDAVGQATAAVKAPDAPRYPGLRTGIVSLQSRNGDFTGRAEELGKLRRRLTEPKGDLRHGGAQALYGLGGVGKSQMAREYAYRYLPDYDVVWWIPAERQSSIVTELVALAERLDLRGSLSDGEAVKAVLNALSQGSPYPRWLLIYDNAENPESLREYLPGGEGHVIITSRNQVWNREATELEVDVFTPAESIAHLCRRIDWMEPQDAARLAHALGDLPLAVEHAAAYLELTNMSVDTYMERLESYPDDMFGEVPSQGYPLSIKTTFAASLEQLEAAWPSGKRLLQMSVFLGPDPFSQALVYKSPEMLRALSQHDGRLRSSPVLLGQVLNAVRRLSLAKVDGRKDTVQVHRVLQSLLRTQMSEEEMAEVRDEVQQILAGQRPLGGEVEDPENRPGFERIRSHLSWCQAELSERYEVRQLMLDQVRLLWRSGSLPDARAEADRIDTAWSDLLGEEHEQTLALRTLRANILRDLGEYRASLELDRKTWESQQRLLGEQHLSTLLSARGMAAGLRAMGSYQEALERDLTTFESLKDQFGDEDRHVLTTAHNLAIDYRLMGDSRSAQKHDESNERIRRLILGPDHERTLGSQLYLARDKRDNGELREAAVDLERLLDTYRRLRGDNYPETLRAARSLAVSRRLMGQFDEAAALTRDTYARYLERYGERHPDTWTCGLNLAADEWIAGRYREALQLAEGIADRFIDLIGENHPNSLACLDNVAVYLRSPGAPEQSLRRSIALGEQITRQLARVLGEKHPFTLCAEVNWANARAEQVNPDLRAVEATERSALRRLGELLGDEHPDSLACQSNLSVTLLALGEVTEAHRLHDDALMKFSRDRSLGDSHPDTFKTDGWERISHVLELHSW